MSGNKIDTLFQKLEEDIKIDDKNAIVASCTKLLGYSHFLDAKTQASLFLVKGIALVKLQRYTLAILNIKQAINIDKNDELGQKALEYVKQRIME